MAIAVHRAEEALVGNIACAPCVALGAYIYELTLGLIVL